MCPKTGSEAVLDGFWPTLTKEQLLGIEAVAMDMWDPYVNSIREHVPEADSKIVFDKFHVAQHLSQALDQVRRKVGTRYDWLKNPTAMAVY